MPSRSRPTLPDRVRRFLEPPRYATIATTSPDCSPHQAVAWYRLEPDGTIVVNSRMGRRWPDDIRRSGRVSVAVTDEADGMRWVGLACDLVEVIDDVEQARDDIVALAHRYHPEGPDPDDIAMFRTQRRVSFRLRPTRVHDHLGD